MLVRIKLFARRINFMQCIFFKGGYQLLQGQFNTRLEAVNGLLRHRQRRFETILDRQQFASKSLDSKFVRLGNIFLSPAADVFALGFGA